jgi:hypothetical protein
MSTKNRFSPDPLFYSIDFKAKKITATEEDLERIYDSAYRGLTGDALALSSGYLPTDFAILCAADDRAANMITYARAVNQAEVSGALMKNALSGDTKAATVIMTHLHGWKPAKPDGDSSQDIRIIVENALPEPKIN